MFLIKSMTVKEKLNNYLKSENYTLDIDIGEIKINKTLLGEGGNGVVYEGHLLNYSVALKFLVTEATGNSKKN